VDYSRSTPTPTELRQGANDLLYEVQMLFNAAAILEDDGLWTNAWGWQGKTFYMATLESFLTHARSLMDFVCPPKHWETQTIHARGIFAPDYCSKPSKPQPWSSLREEHRQISQEIQHLTLDRPLVARNWPYADLRNKLSEKLLAFLPEADRLSDQIRDGLRGILVDGVRVSTADTDTSGTPVSTLTITSFTAGVSGATSLLIDPAQITDSGKPQQDHR
jgi:hypothetical protein